MKFAVISIFPEMFNALTNFGVVGRAIVEKKSEVFLVNPRSLYEGCEVFQTV